MLKNNNRNWVFSTYLVIHSYIFNFYVFWVHGSYVRLMYTLYVQKSLSKKINLLETRGWKFKDNSNYSYFGGHRTDYR